MMIFQLCDVYLGLSKESVSFRPLGVSPQVVLPLVVSPLVVSPQEEISTYFVEIYVNS